MGWNKYQYARLKPPCQNCQKREPGCHSSCEEYIKYERQNNLLREKRAKENEFTGVIIDNASNRNKALTRNKARIKHGRRGA